MPFCHILDIIYPSNVHCFLTAKEESRGKVREVSYLPFPGGVQNKNKENPRLACFSPLKLQQLEEGKKDLGGGRNRSGVAGASSQISTEQVLLPARGRGMGGHRVLAAGAGG